MKQVVGWFVVAAAMVGIVGGLGYIKYQQIQAGIAIGKNWPEPREAVASVPVRTGTWSRTARAIGTVVAVQQVEIRNEIAGVVSAVGFRSGEVVEAGRTLVKLDTRQEEAALAAAQAEARLAKYTLDRRTGLRGSPAFSEQEFDKAQEDLAAAKARSDNIAVTIDKKKILAPFAGKTGITNLQPGAYLDAGARITTLEGQASDVYVDFSLPQDDAVAVKVGAKVVLSDAAHPGEKIDAEIIAEDNSVDRANRTVAFRAIVRGVGALVRSGMFLDVTIETMPPRDAVLVPLTALRRSSQGTHVFVLRDEDGKLRARMRAVTIGDVKDGDVVVLDGLTPGEVIAASGSFKLRDGLLVEGEAKANAATTKTGSESVN